MTYLHLSILTSISIIGNHHGNATCTTATQRRDHEQQLHHVVVHRWSSRLHNVTVLSPYVFMNLYTDFTIRKLPYRSFAEVQLQMPCNGHGEGHVAIATENLQTSAVLFNLLGGNLEIDFFFGHLIHSVRSIKSCWKRRTGGTCRL